MTQCRATVRDDFDTKIPDKTSCMLAQDQWRCFVANAAASAAAAAAAGRRLEFPVLLETNNMKNLPVIFFLYWYFFSVKIPRVIRLRARLAIFLNFSRGNNTSTIIIYHVHKVYVHKRKMVQHAAHISSSERSLYMGSRC